MEWRGLDHRLICVRANQARGCYGRPQLACRTLKRREASPTPTHVFCFCSNCTFFWSSLFWAVQASTLQRDGSGRKPGQGGRQGGEETGEEARNALPCCPAAPDPLPHPSAPRGSPPALQVVHVDLLPPPAVLGRLLVPDLPPDSLQDPLLCLAAHGVGVGQPRASPPLPRAAPAFQPACQGFFQPLALRPSSTTRREHQAGHPAGQGPGCSVPLPLLEPRAGQGAFTLPRAFGCPAGQVRRAHLGQGQVGGNHDALLLQELLLLIRQDQQGEVRLEKQKRWWPVRAWEAPGLRGSRRAAWPGCLPACLLLPGALLGVLQWEGRGPRWSPHLPTFLEEERELCNWQHCKTAPSPPVQTSSLPWG